MLPWMLLVWMGRLPGQEVDTAAAHACWVEAEKLYEVRTNHEVADSLFRQASQGFAGYPEAQLRAHLRLIDLRLRHQRVEAALDAIQNLLPETLARYGAEHWRVGQLQYRLAVGYYRQRRFEEALQQAAQARAALADGPTAAHLDLASTYNTIGNTHFRQGQYQKAREAFLAAYQCHQPDGPSQALAAAANNVGISYAVINRHEEALRWYERTRELYEIAGFDSLGMSYLYQNLGISHQKRGDNHQALSYLRKAARIQVALVDSCFRPYLDNLLNISTMCRNTSRLGEAEQAILRVKELVATCPGLPTEMDAQVLMRLGKLQVLRGDTTQGLGTLTQARRRYQSIEGFSAEKAAVSLKIGDIHRHRRQYEQAMAAYQAVPDLFSAPNRVRNVDVSVAYTKQGMLLREQQQWEAALGRIQQGLATLQPDLSPQDLWWEQPPARWHVSMAVVQNLQQRMRLLLAWQEAEPQRIDLLDAAYQTYEVSRPLLDSLPQQVVQEESRLDLLEKTMNTYRPAMVAVHRLYRATQNPRWVQAAFDISERGKAALLLAALKADRLGAALDDRQSFLAREAALRREVAYCRQRLRERGARADSAQVLAWQEAQLAAQEALAAWQDSVAQALPSYYQTVYARQPVALPALQAQLARDSSSLVSFFIGEEAVFAHWVQADTVLFQRLALAPERLTQQVRQVRALIESRDGDRADLAAGLHGLYRALLAPGLSALPTRPQRLLVVPDGWLAYVPISAWLTQLPAAAQGYDQWPYLLRQMAVGYTHAAQWHLLTTATAPPTDETYQAFGPAFAGETSPLALRDAAQDSSLWRRLPDLPGRTREIAALAQHFDGQSWTGPHVSEDLFKTHAPETGILHLITHGLVDDQEPMGSFLVFSPPRADEQEDGRLFAWELYDLELEAALVVLSACNTGIGQPRQGEGLMSLARAFHFAGAPSLLATLWPLQDQSAGPLMTQFYGQLAQGRGKDRALAAAQQAYLAQCEPLLAHPFYWAGWASIGDQRALPPATDHGGWLWGWGLLLGAAMAGLWWGWRRRAG